MAIPNRNIKGNSSILIAIVFFLIALAGFYFYGTASLGVQKNRIRGVLDLEAQMYALELAEFFASMNQIQITNYLTNISYYATLPEYHLCAHINIKDESTGIRVNPDDSAQLPESALRGKRARRYYKVDVVNKTDMTPNDGVCFTNFSGYTLTASGNEAYLVTVYVDYYEEDGNSLKYAIASALISEQ